MKTGNLDGYAKGWSALDAALILANVSETYTLTDRGRKYSRKELPAYVADLKRNGKKMDLSHIAVSGSDVWCRWQVGHKVGAGLITLGKNGPNGPIEAEQIFNT